MKPWKCLKRFFLHKYRYYKDHRLTPEYKARKSVVKNWWIYFGAAAIVLLQFPNTAGILVALLLGMTFLSFAFLDEWKQFKQNCDKDNDE